MSKDHDDESGNQADQENRQTADETDQKNQEREESFSGSGLVFFVLDFFHNGDSVFFADSNASLVHVIDHTDIGHEENRESGD